ncbi:MAG: CoA pyrophosphatase [Bacteroidota bacterium]|jgi:8-oxo-dGTP pyrophosphatase MutT (NUDIX family)
MPDITLAHIRSFFSSFCREEINNHTLIHAGVLVPLFMQNGELHVILTQRTEEVEQHKGQISFPGGTMDRIDATIIDTALREAEKEIGLTQKAVEVLGMLNDFCTPSGFCITPIVGFLLTVPSFILNKTEVSEVFNVPLSFFIDSRNERIDCRKYSGKLMNLYFYVYGKYKIWGATAEILRTFLHAFNTETSTKRFCKSGNS